MYWHRTHQTSLRIKNTSRESMPCTMCAWYCGWGDHNLPQDTSCDIFILYFHFIFSFHRKTHLRCISSVLLHYNCKINANIQDVYHRPNLERAPKGRLPLVVIVSNINNQLMRLITVYKMELLEDCEYIN